MEHTKPRIRDAVVLLAVIALLLALWWPRAEKTVAEELHHTPDSVMMAVDVEQPQNGIEVSGMANLDRDARCEHDENHGPAFVVIDSGGTTHIMWQCVSTPERISP